MTITWLEKKELIAIVPKKLKGANVVLDIGCGILPQSLVRAQVHICCDPFGEYVALLQRTLVSEWDRTYIILQASWADVVELFPPKSVDTVFLMDVIEHVEKDEALRLLRITETLARKQVAVYTPLGFLPQSHPDGTDAWGLHGGAWQEHKSGWEPKDFGESWDIYAARVYHTHDNLGKEFSTPYGALWAIRTFDSPEVERKGPGWRKRKAHIVLDAAADRIARIRGVFRWE